MSGRKCKEKGRQSDIREASKNSSTKRRDVERSDSKRGDVKRSSDGKRSDGKRSRSDKEQSDEKRVRKLSSRADFRNRMNILKGDATDPVGSGKKIIAHICNNAGFWGKGFVMSVSKRWKQPEITYRELEPPISMGLVQFVAVSPDITVANMIAQLSPYVPNPLQYDTLRKCLKQLRRHARKRGFSVHMPKIGAGLGRGDWSIIKEIIMEELVKKEISVYIYEFNEAGRK